MSERRCSKRATRSWHSRRSTRRRSALVGGKGASLGELARNRWHPGARAVFCVTTDAFRRIVASAFAVDEALDRLTRLDPGDRDGIRTHAAELRKTIEAIAMPDEFLAAAIISEVARTRRARCLRGSVERDGQRTCPPHPSLASKTRS